MAITAAMTAAASTGTAPVSITFTCTVTNNNSTAANVKGGRPFVRINGRTDESDAAVAGLLPLGPGMPVNVTASGGTLALTFAVTFFAPFSGSSASSPVPQPANPASAVYEVGCIVQTDATGADAFVTATTTTVTISAPSAH